MRRFEAPDGRLVERPGMVRFAALGPSRAVALATIAYALLFTALGANRYITFHAGADLGLFAQTIVSAFGGFHNTVERSSHFAYHFSPILYLLAPLLWLTRSALALVAMQALATALIAPAVYAIARKRVADSWAAGLACIVLAYPPLQGVTFTDFHEVAFMPAAVAWLLWAIDARRFGVALVLLLVVMSIKEDQAPAMAFLGVLGCLYFGRRDERAGLQFSMAAIAVSIVVFWGYFALVRPLAGAPGHWMPSHFYAWSANGPVIGVGRQMGGRLTYLLEAFVPLAFIPLRSRVLILSLPGFAEVLLSREPLTYTMGQHYAAVWIPYVAVAFALGAADLIASSPPAGARWVRTSAVLCIAVSIFFSPLHLGHFLRWPSERDRILQADVDRIPKSAGVGTYDEIYAHLGFAANGQIGLDGSPEYVLYDDRYVSTTWTQQTLPQLLKAVSNGTYVVANQRDGIVLLRRTR